MTILIIFLHHLFISFLLTTLTWCIYLYYRNMSIIDMTWALGFLALIIYDYAYFLPQFTPAQNQVDYIYPTLIFLICLWSLRLSSFIFFTRLKHNHLDHRYEAIKANWKEKSSLKVLFNYWFQGFLQACLSISFIPLLFTNINTSFLIIPIVISLIGIVGEALSDYQLLMFKKTASTDTICKIGLWRFSRHPNYFFDILFWFGVSLYTFLYSKIILVFASPVLLYSIMRFITGRISENISLTTKGNSYKAYQESTPMIFPIPFLRSNS